MKKLIIAYDLDECLADTMKNFLKFHNEKYGTNYVIEDILVFDKKYVWGGTYEDIIRKYDEFYAIEHSEDIEPITGAKEAVNELRKITDKQFVITARPEYMRKRTIKWIEEHFPGMFDEIILTDGLFISSKKKSDICKELGVDIIIEDSPSTILACEKEGINAIAFLQPWNKNADIKNKFATWNEIKEYIIDKNNKVI